MNPQPLYNIFPLGDNALVLDFGNIIDEQINKLVHSVFYQLQNDPIPGMTEAVPGYSSLTIYYDVLFIRNKLDKQPTAFHWACESLKKYISTENIETGDPEVLIKIPVCYDKEYGTELDFIASQNNIPIEEINNLH